MLKKGQASWIDNAKPVGTEPQIEEYVRVPHKNKGKKRFGIRWKRKEGSKSAFNWNWAHWYHTERDRDEAAKAFGKNSHWLSINYEMEYVER